MDERLKPGQLHETPAEDNPADTYPEEGDVEFGMREMEDYPHFPPYDPPKATRAADEGSSAELRSERQGNAESGGYDDPRYGKVRSLPSQK
ncbi:MAG: hypothetical protein KAI84_20715 [Gammaproteobacteria bacterium]|nr:hypothetical protein [Gammaproteobacteria bacterium]